MITHHKNLEHLRSAKRLNPRAVGRSSLLGSNSPSPIDLKRNMSRQNPSPVSTLLKNPPHQNPAILVSPIRWALEEHIRVTTLSEPATSVRPRGKTYMPTSMRSTLLGSVHASPGSGHPGSQRTLSLLQAQYWWPSMAWDVSLYVRGCSVFAISKSLTYIK